MTIPTLPYETKSPKPFNSPLYTTVIAFYHTTGYLLERLISAGKVDIYSSVDNLNQGRWLVGAKYGVLLEQPDIEYAVLGQFLAKSELLHT